MSKLNLFNGESKVISSKEIAELTGKRHDHVLRDIDKVLVDLELEPTQYWGRYKDAKGEERKCYNLPKRESMILASGYNVKLRAAIIDRWAELELKEQSQLPQTFAQALQLAADQAKQIELQESQMKEQAPKVLMAETLLLSDEAITLEKFAKSIGSFGRTKMFALLRDQGFLINKGSSKNIPYQKYITNGYFEVIEKPFMKPGDIKCIGTQTLITPKGQERVLKIIKKQDKSPR